MRRESESREKALERVRQYNMYDDSYIKLFMTREIAEFMVRIVLDRDDIVFTEFIGQKEMSDTVWRGVRFDYYAEDRDGRKMAIEIQKVKDDFPPQRALHYMSSLVTHCIRRGGEWHDIPETWTIVFFERDPRGEGCPLYHYQYRTAEGKELGDGSHILYVNGDNRDTGTALGRLMYDMRCGNPEDMVYDNLRQRAVELKEKEADRMVAADTLMYKEGFGAGHAEGHAKGHAEGERDKAVKMVRTLCKKNVCIADLADAAEISEEEVLRILSEE